MQLSYRKKRIKSYEKRTVLCEKRIVSYRIVQEAYHTVQETYRIVQTVKHVRSVQETYSWCSSALQGLYISYMGWGGGLSPNTLGHN